MVDIAVIPVAGFGTRFLPLTKSQPKEMIGIVDKPVIHYIVEEAAKSGIKTIVFVTGRHKRAIEDYFDASPELEYHLEKQGKYKLLKIVKEISNMIEPIYVRQKEAKGLGHAILMAKKVIGNRPFAVLLGDEIIEDKKPLLKSLIDKFETYQTSILSVYEVSWEKVSSYGIVSGKPLEEDPNLLLIEDLIEKPSLNEAPSNLAIIGRYVLTPEIFKYLKIIKPDKKGEYQLTDALKLLSKKDVIYAYKFKGLRFDTGDKLEYLKATLHFAVNHKEIGEDFKIYLKEFASKLS